MKNINNACQGNHSKLHCKDSEAVPEKQEFFPIYKDIANQDAVKAEIGDVLEVFNYEIRMAKAEVMTKKDANPLKYKMRGFYSQDLNATIKERLLRKMDNDPSFRNKVRVKSNSGSIYFVVKDKYILYVKRLYGNQNKPNSYPTPQSEKLFNNTLFLGEIKHIPILFIGPNLGNIRENDAFVTSLISRKELNWTETCSNLFSSTDVITLTPTPVEETEKEIARIKPELAPVVKTKKTK